MYFLFENMILLPGMISNRVSNFQNASNVHFEPSVPFYNTKKTEVYCEMAVESSIQIPKKEIETKKKDLGVTNQYISLIKTITNTHFKSNQIYSICLRLSILLVVQIRSDFAILYNVNES